MMQSESIGAISKALAEAQKELANPVKNKEAKAGSYSYKYADIADVLDCVRPVLSKNGIAVTQPTILDGEILIVQTRLSHLSGEFMSSDYPVCRINGDHQKMGSAMTYARRYSLCSMVGVAADDDTDGQGAAAVEAPKQRKSSAAAKRDGDWPKLQADLADCQSAVSVDRLQRDYQATEYKAWNADWRREADEMFEKRRADFDDKAPGEALTLHEQLKGSLEPATRAEYVQHAHDTIANFDDAKTIETWWKEERPARRRFSLNTAEVDDLKARVIDKRNELTEAPHGRDKAGRPLVLTEAG